MVNPILLLSAGCLVLFGEGEEEKWAKRWERKGWGDWRDLVGPVDLRCRFRIRLGLDGVTEPQLVLSTNETLGPESVLNRRLLCVYDDENLKEAGPALLVVSNSIEYLFRQWPYLANRIVFGISAKMRTFAWIGELPEELAETVSPTCLSSRQGSLLPCGDRCRTLRSIYMGDPLQPNSNHYNKILAARIVLDHPMVTGLFYVDLDAYYTRDAVASPKTYRRVHDDGKWDLQFATPKAKAFWLVKGGRFYARKGSRFATDVLDMWMTLRCGFKDQWSLWQAILTLSCVEYNDQLLNMTVQEAMKDALHAFPEICLSLDDARSRCNHSRGFSNYNVIKMTHFTSPIHRSVYPWDVTTFTYSSRENRTRFLNVSNLLVGLSNDGHLLEALSLDRLHPSRIY